MKSPFFLVFFLFIYVNTDYMAEWVADLSGPQIRVEKVRMGAEGG